ncbi:hypothetical protein KC207_13015 [Phycicoccus sp. BSK3Z-2]|uniref:Uncharacterized protein n=1 Tax=Phycicoccus avicenniae TaxID=2828860 RepID=A0A941D956_9MICO|nr:hypothetical protein [Phycicoccus avicenniae]MBR7744208.1 hypothetical protein [Phycicoccus avicenniae]
MSIPPGAAPTRPRPARGWWWAAGLTSVLGLLAVLAAVVLMLLGGVQALVAPVALVRAGEEPVTVAAPAGKDLLLMVTPGADVRCVVRDAGGIDVPTRRSLIGSTVTVGDRRWVGESELTVPASGRLTFACTAADPDASARVVGAPAGFATWATRVGVLVVGGLVLVAGLLWLLALVLRRIGASDAPPVPRP